MHFLIYFLPRLYAHLPKNSQPIQEMGAPPQEKVFEIYRPMGLFLGFYGM